MYIRGDLKQLARVVAGEAALSATRHDLPPQPGRQWHSPLDAWQPSAWTQLHLFRQPGPNVPICTCEQMPRRRRVVRGLGLSDAPRENNFQHSSAEHGNSYLTSSVLFFRVMCVCTKLCLKSGRLFSCHGRQTRARSFKVNLIALLNRHIISLLNYWLVVWQVPHCTNYTSPMFSGNNLCLNAVGQLIIRKVHL